MYLRWTVRTWTSNNSFAAKSYGRKQETRHLLRAVLVTAARVDGKPRQTFVRQLGSIHTDRIDCHEARASFWQAVEKNLASLDLPAAQIAAIVARITERVPAPSVTSPRAGAPEEEEDLDDPEFGA